MILGNDFLETNEASIDFYKQNLIVNINSTMHHINLMDDIQKRPIIRLRAVLIIPIAEPSMMTKQNTLADNLRKKKDMVLNEFPEVFSEAPVKMKDYNCVIRLKHDKPMNQRPYQIPISMKEAVNKEIQSMINLDIIQILRSLYSLEKEESMKFQDVINSFSHFKNPMYINTDA